MASTGPAASPGRRWLLPLFALVVLVSVAAAASSRQVDWSPWWLVLLLALLCLAAELIAAPNLPQSRMPVMCASSMATFCAIVLLGAASAATIAMVAVGAEGLARRKRMTIVLGNVANYGIATLLGGLLADAIFAERILTTGTAFFGFLLYVLVDLMTFAIVTVTRRMAYSPPPSVSEYGQQLARSLPSVAVSAILAVLAIWTYQTAGGVALGLLGAGLLLVQRLMERLSAVEFELRAERDRARAYLDSAGSPFVLLDGDLRIEDANRRAAQLLGGAEGELVGRPWLDFVVDEERDAFSSALDSEDVEPVRLETRLHTAAGGDRYVLWSIVHLDVPPHERQTLLSGEDVTERRLAEQRLEHMAFHDPLTGLPNRAAFAQVLAERLASAETRGVSVGAAFIDLDGFKDVNDVFGHAVGDALLRHVATRLSSGVREGDIVARQSGDEFLVLVDDLPSDDGEARAVIGAVLERMLDALSAPYMVEGTSVWVAGSVGLAVHPADGDEPETLIAVADREMYARKAAAKPVSA